MAKIMGILNVTPDSYFDGGLYFSHENAIKKGIKIENDGADIIDIGGESTRPYSDPVSEEDELSRVIPVIEELIKHVNIPISIDTIKPKVAEKAIIAGASMINDVSGFQNPEMRRVAANYDVDICVMHMQGNPKSMQKNPQYSRGVIEEIRIWFENQISLLLNAGIKKSKIILDPGIGFGKTVADNCKIIHNLHLFKAMGFPLLLGMSRKFFIYSTLNKKPSEVLSATIGVNSLALMAGVDVIRVHDVKEHRDVITFLNAYEKLRV